MIAPEISAMPTLIPNPEFSRLASEEQVMRTARALEANGMHAILVDTAEQARALAAGMLPHGATVYDPPSQTLQQIGLLNDLQARADLKRLRPQVQALDRKTQQAEIRRLTSSPDVVLGSVHAITEQGQVMLASASGSQMASAAFGAGTVIWVVGTQKVVSNLDEGFRRIREYSYPLEDERARKVYGRGSAINKVLIVNGEQPGRITVVLVKQNLGF